ncbi:MAG: hypothetical protein JSR62_14950 [Nitrospira sp.]|nr:hypothetical protein [Nitrospira sp.]
MFGLEQWGQATHPFFSQHQTFTNFLIGGTVLLAILIKLIKGEHIWANYPPVGWLVIALFSYALASTIWAPRPELSQSIWASRGPYAVTFLLLTPLLIGNTKDIQVTFKAMILMGTTLTILLLAFVSWDSRAIVLEGGHGNPLAVSQMAGMVTLVAILADPWKSKVWQVLRWAVVALCLILVIRSGARGQLVGIVLVSVVCWPLSHRVKNVGQVILLIGLMGFLAGVTSLGLQEFWSKQSSYYAGGSRWSTSAMEGAMAERLDQAFYLLHLWFQSIEKIIFGLGNSAAFDPHILGIYPHFVPLEILAEEGLIGFGLYLLTLYWLGRSSFRGLRILRNEPEELLVFGTLVSLTLFTLILSFKQGNLLGNLEFFMFATILDQHSNSLMHRSRAPKEIAVANAFDSRGPFSVSGVARRPFSDFVPTIGKK